MQLAGALLPLGLMANPTPEAAAAPEAVSDAGESLDTRAFSRPQHCSIVGGSSTVNCRTGPNTKYRVKMTMRKGNTYDFWCVYSGQCVTINGFRNCGWHYSKQHDCFVSGHYTDNRCTLARLGSCGNFDDDNSAAGPF
ncbi:hypothetical protein C8A01DRAFT_34849 [Parachaetomium inaequale]|uniref:Uncharacterized protein n=1 Tax=Parachaetomium inaequale TaxID=2588326 RepID=A0AAN6PLJ3_9PEZI|nr:hypothetical protein C8A01DRAFT_34849 [Parachaetomium inaequale]